MFPIATLRCSRASLSSLAHCIDGAQPQLTFVTRAKLPPKVTGVQHAVSPCTPACVRTPWRWAPGVRPRGEAVAPRNSRPGRERRQRSHRSCRRSLESMHALIGHGAYLGAGRTRRQPCDRRRQGTRAARRADEGGAVVQDRRMWTQGGTRTHPASDGTCGSMACNPGAWDAVRTLASV